MCFTEREAARRQSKYGIKDNIDTEPFLDETQEDQTHWI